MLEIISAEQDIDLAQKLFEDVMKMYSDNQIEIPVGFQGDSISCSVCWSGKLGIWFAFNEIENRFWNAFGTDKPNPKRSHSITCEINIPYSGLNRSISGAFAKNLVTGEIFVVHRGRVGGGRKGIGKIAFLNQYHGELERVIDGDRINEVILLGNLEDPSFAYKISSFVKGVGMFKNQNKY